MPQPPAPALDRKLGILNATTVNMSNMVGIGPFITIPILLGALGGPQSYIAWLVGALIALADGLVVSELGAALPAAGGSYVFLRDAFDPRKAGRCMAFLFVWQLLFSGPLEIASGNIGLVQYVKVFLPQLTDLQMKFLAAGIGIFVIFALYRKIADIARIMMGLWVIMIATTLLVVLTGIIYFKPSLAWDFPPNAFNFNFEYLKGLGKGSATVLYLFLGYDQICYLGGEVKDPGRTIPRAVVYSVLAVAAIEIAMSIGFIGVIPWREAMTSQSIGSLFMERTYGAWAGQLLALLIIVTAFASIFALLLGYSRVPYAAAQDGVFFRWLGELHPEKAFPHRSLILVGSAAVCASFFSLEQVILALMAARILIQFLARTIGVIVLRRKNSGQVRPFSMWGYPLPAILSLTGYIYIFLTLGLNYILFGILTIAAGVVVYLAASWKQGHWPFQNPSE